ncbi:MAG: c-type cytochrome [Myxococcales bacterium]|nr:c-type cytochrome [Myxococcales bacterium]
MGRGLFCAPLLLLVACGSDETGDTGQLRHGADGGDRSPAPGEEDTGQDQDGVDGGLEVSRPIAELEPGEPLSGGETTNTLLLGANAFTRPAANLDAESERSFFTGNSFFNQSWVEAPSSTEARDGLGPTFNARSCSGCHFKDGRGQPFDSQGNGLGLLIRLSVPGQGAHGGPLADERYGGQLQDRAITGVTPEGAVHIEYAELPGSYDDGEPYSLRQPTYRIEAPAFGALPDDLRMSPRVAPAVIGMGLLEAIEDSRLAELADPDDADRDGISGRLNRVWDVQLEAMAVGRFGWKAEQPTVLQQSAGAFLGDMGITSRLFPSNNCPAPQLDCASAPSAGEPEIEDDTLDKVGLYTATLAVPVRRDSDDPAVLRGKLLFGETGCVDCHTPSHTTGESSIEALSGQLIWPYTDLLLHDMGEALSDGRPSFDAEGAEWRTPPLWGIGLIEDVNDHLFLLHDGRARGFAEAILWHGGEGEASAEAFRALDAEDRAALIRFLESL